MKTVALFFFLLVFHEAQADAGFSIRRKKAASNISFSGVENLKSYMLLRVLWYSNKKDDSTFSKPFIVEADTITNDSKIYIQEGGRRWEESDRDLKFVLIDRVTGLQTDSFYIYTKKYDFHLNISGVKEGKLQYKIKKTKAVYSYGILSEGETTSESRTNRWIFILSSLLGFIMLVVVFLKRKKIQTV